MARMLRSLAVMSFVAGFGVVIGITASASPDVILVAKDEPPAKETQPKKKVGTVRKKTSKKAPSKSAMADDETSKAEAPAGTFPAGTSGEMKFSRDIAPIIVANCAGCHTATHRSGFNQTTFEGLLKGGKAGKDIVPGKPEESPAIVRIKGGEEGMAKMPPGNRQLAEGAIAKIEQWIKEGAKLDAGYEPSALMAKYAASPEDLRKAELAKMSPDDRDKKTEATSFERLKRADPNSKLAMTKSAHFMLFSELPKDRSSLLLKSIEKQYSLLTQILGAGKLNFPEKVSLYVFNQPKGLTEFARTIENQEIEAGDEARAKLGVESPYIIAIDPLAGGPEAPLAASKKPSRSKKGADDAPSGPSRTLIGLLTEQLTAGSLAVAGKPPRWVTTGVGALMASKVEPRSSYYRKLRAEAYEQARLGWQGKAQEALGDTTKPETVKAVGFAVAEWLYSNNPALLANFVRGMLEGGPKLDEVIGEALGSNREEFLSASGEFVVLRYGPGR